MRTFAFKAKHINGKIMTGSVKANSRGDLIRRLSSKNLEPLFIEEKQSFFASFFSAVNPKHVVTFTRQMSFLLSAGVSITQALQIVQSMIPSQAFKFIIKDVADNIQGGDTLSGALSNHPGVFNNMFVSIIRAGEQSGNLDKMLSQLADYVEESAQIKNKIKKAMMYPAFIFVVGLLVTGVIMVMVVPKFASIFESSDVPLPAMTKALLTLSDFFVNNILKVLMAVIFIPMGAFLYLSSAHGRKLKDQLFMLLPIFGKLFFQGGVARFTRTLSYLVSAGVGIVEALKTSAITSSNFFIETAVQSVSRQVVKGRSLAQSLKSHSIMPSLLVSMVSIGEETGRVDATLAKVADFYEEQVRTMANNMTSLIQPFLIVFLGGIVGFVVIALYLPIIKMPGVMGGM